MMVLTFIAGYVTGVWVMALAVYAWASEALTRGL